MALSTVVPRRPFLVNVPGESSTVVTCFDGYAMAKARPSRTCPGDCGIRFVYRRYLWYRCLMLVAIPLGEFALKFGPPSILP